MTNPSPPGFGSIKLHYLAVYAVIGAQAPYISIFLKRQDFSEFEIGWVIGLQGLAVLISPVLITAVADRWLSNRLLMAICYLLGGAALFALTLCHSVELAVAASVAYSLGQVPLLPILDGLTFAANSRRAASGAGTVPYHRIRIYGTLGFMFPSLGIFFLLRYTALSAVAAIHLGAAIGLLGLLMCALLPSDQPLPQEKHREWPTKAALKALWREPLRTMVGSLFLCFLAMGSLSAFFSLYLVDLGVSDEWVGLIINLGVFLEVFFMLGAGRILSAIGVRGVLVLGALATAARYVLLAAWPNLLVAVGTQIFHGPMVLCMFLLPPMVLNEKAEPAYRNSIQGLHWMLSGGVARIVGTIVMGYVAGFGLEYAFWLAAGLSLAASAWLALCYFEPASPEVPLRHENVGESQSVPH